jgi:N-acetylglutamate synthase-like GNAT family acetyltransferase
VRVAIRPWQESDTQGIRDLILPIQNDEFSLPTSWEEQPDLHDISGYYCKGRGDFWVAVARDKVVGSISLVELADDNAALRKMFVAADYRGGELGVAANLLDMLINHATAAGLARVYLGTTSAFKAAHRFYEKHGFDLVDRDTLPADFSFMKLDTRFYLRTLGS